MKDFFADQGTSDIAGSRDAVQAAFAQGLVIDGEGWMEMIKSRNQTSHTYNEDTAREIATLIRESYYPEFEQLKTRLERER
jgi:nucleotidyltransferase substrate binding protein (TIGR01987 family)